MGRRVFLTFSLKLNQANNAQLHEKVWAARDRSESIPGESIFVLFADIIRQFVRRHLYQY